MTDTEPEPTDAEWEPDDTATDAPADTTSTDEQPATPTNPPPPGMKLDEASGKLIDTGEPRSREAKYRLQLRATERERDQLRERLEQRDKAEVEHLVLNRLIDPQDLWAGGVTLADVTNPDCGEISTELLDEAVTRVIKAHPHWRFSAAAPASQVTSPHAGVDPDQQAPTWQSLFQNATRKA